MQDSFKWIYSQYCLTINRAIGSGGGRLKHVKVIIEHMAPKLWHDILYVKNGCVYNNEILQISKNGVVYTTVGNGSYCPHGFIEQAFGENNSMLRHGGNNVYYVSYNEDISYNEEFGKFTFEADIKTMANNSNIIQALR